MTCNSCNDREVLVFHSMWQLLGRSHEQSPPTDLMADFPNRSRISSSLSVQVVWLWKRAKPQSHFQINSPYIYNIWITLYVPKTKVTGATCWDRAGLHRENTQTCMQFNCLNFELRLKLNCEVPLQATKKKILHGCFIEKSSENLQSDTGNITICNELFQIS